MDAGALTRETRDQAADARLTLRVTEIFLSLQGEARDSGSPTVFVRLTGCPLRCQYCDSAYAFHGGEKLTLRHVLDQVSGFGVRHVCVTGGEPLAQRYCLDLLVSLCDQGYHVSLETSGALDISNVDRRVSRVVDIKTPGSGELARNRWQNLDVLSAHDQVKFVICDRTDYEWALNVVRERTWPSGCDLWFSPSFGQLTARQLADWMVEDRAPVRLQLQLHKQLWGDVPGK